LALRLGLEVWQPARCRAPEFLEQLRATQPELIVVVAYGQILPQTLLDLPRHGCLNVHTSLLPRHRGAAPIQWAILEGDTETGVTLMKMDAGLDTGAVLAREVTADLVRVEVVESA
jgi:methionyl-tRNA formyltransferase